MYSRVRASHQLVAGLLHRARPQARPGRAGWLASLALAGAAAGCAVQPTVALPPKPPGQAAAAVLTDPQQGAREQVIAAYTGYWQASSAAVDAGNAAAARALLVPYLPASAIPGVITALQPDWARHVVSTGSPLLHILSVKITGRHALVHDCVDLSHAGLADARTGRAYPRSFGSAHENFYADLVLIRGHWLVSNLVPVVAVCEP